jgi:hypothetical protein
VLVVGIIMFVVLMPFFALKELGRFVGDGKLYELFFVRGTKRVGIDKLADLSFFPSNER